MKTNGETAAEELRLLLERLERLHEERDGISGDIADVIAEAKGRGFSGKTLEAIRKIRKKAKEEFQEEEAILELYMQNLGML
nr:GapR family DNA-binding domain-containing protein [Sphingomonas faeni]